MKGELSAHDDFITVWDMPKGGILNIGLSAAKEWELDLLGKNAVKEKWPCWIDWGDGVKERITYFRGGRNHTYEKAGIYTVSISNTVVEFSVAMHRLENKQRRLLDVKQWGTAKWRTLAHMFYGSYNMTMSATDAPDISKRVSARHMFGVCTKFNSPINHWDTDSINDAYAMLTGADAFNQDLSRWESSYDKLRKNEPLRYMLNEKFLMFERGVTLEEYHAKRAKRHLNSILNNSDKKVAMIESL